MQKRYKTIGITVLAFLIAIFIFSIVQDNEPTVQAQLVNSPPGLEEQRSSGGFTRVEHPQPLSFPQDHGPHPDYQTEWWYYTGNLDTQEGRHFGYQLTFFRRALQPPAETPQRESQWGTNQVYLAHFAITDVGSETFFSTERYARGAVGLAGAQAQPFQVWLEDWQVKSIGASTYQLLANEDGHAIELILRDKKGPILHGNRGYSQKGPDPGNASIYISFTRLETEGTIRIAGNTYAVKGWSWMDHEYSTSALAEDQIGWDWFSIQLDNNSELMVFQIRKADGSIDPFSSGTFIKPDGGVLPIDKNQFMIESGKTWRSRESGTPYPAEWSIAVPSLALKLTLEPFLNNQELNVSYTYWEGAVKVNGTLAGEPIQGVGYVEMTGYARSMAGEF